MRMENTDKTAKAACRTAQSSWDTSRLLGEEVKVLYTKSVLAMEAYWARALACGPDKLAN